MNAKYVQKMNDKNKNNSEKQEDLDINKKPKLDSHQVWLVDVWMPRKFVDTALQDKDEFTDEIDTSELSDAYESGLDDETNIGQNK